MSGGGFEADDFACTYARVAEKAGYRVTVISGDRDLFQLASDTIRVAIPHKGYQAAEYLGPAEVFKKFGVTPEQVPSYKGLVGDSSDNLKGVKGIGPKAAEVLIQKYGSIENIYTHLPEIKEAWRSKLEADREQAFFCERMALLKSDIDLTIPLEDLEFTGIHTGPILKLFADLEFFLVTRRFLSLLESPYGRAHFIADAATEAEEIFGQHSSRSQKSGASVAASPAPEPSQLSLL